MTARMTAAAGSTLEARSPLPVRNRHTDAAWRAVYEAACAPYRRGGLSGHWGWRWARGKLAHDPAFRALLERGDLPPQARVVDIGCGQGLLASLLQAAAAVAASGRWPSDWPPAPSATAYTGIELMAREVARGQAALSAVPPSAAGQTGLAPQLVCADMRQAPLPACDVVVILDVLHYVDHAAQNELLRRVHAALAPRGRLLLRVGDTARRSGFAISQWVDRLVNVLLRRHAPPRRAGRTLAEWVALLQTLGFAVRSVPMSQGTLFANVLLVADLRADPPAELPPGPQPAPQGEPQAAAAP